MQYACLIQLGFSFVLIYCNIMNNFCIERQSFFMTVDWRVEVDMIMVRPKQLGGRGVGGRGNPRLWMGVRWVL